MTIIPTIRDSNVSADRKRLINVGLTLLHRLRRWTNVKPTLIRRFVSAGVVHVPRGIEPQPNLMSHRTRLEGSMKLDKLSGVE